MGGPISEGGWSIDTRRGTAALGAPKVSKGYKCKGGSWNHDDDSDVVALVCYDLGMIWDDLGTNNVNSNKAGCRVNGNMVLDGCSDAKKLLPLWSLLWFLFMAPTRVL